MSNHSDPKTPWKFLVVVTVVVACVAFFLANGDRLGGYVPSVAPGACDAAWAKVESMNEWDATLSPTLSDCETAADWLRGGADSNVYIEGLTARHIAKICGRQAKATAVCKDTFGYDFHKDHLLVEADCLAGEWGEWFPPGAPELTDESHCHHEGPYSRSEPEGNHAACVRFYHDMFPNGDNPADMCYGVR